MDTNQRLLVLDAVLCACEQVSVPSEIREHMLAIQDWMDDNLAKDLNHEDFIAAQIDSVEQFAKHPEFYS